MHSECNSGKETNNVHITFLIFAIADKMGENHYFGPIGGAHWTPPHVRVLFSARSPLKFWDTIFTSLKTIFQHYKKLTILTPETPPQWVSFARSPLKFWNTIFPALRTVFHQWNTNKKHWPKTWDDSLNTNESYINTNACWCKY